jgi:hypothetical protein
VKRMNWCGQLTCRLLNSWTPPFKTFYLLIELKLEF